MKRTFFCILALAVLAVCFAAPGFAAADPLPPVNDALLQMSDSALALMNAAPSGEASSEESVLPLVPGAYESGDGSLLKVKEDGAATYETEVSGAVNGNAMSGRLTFHGAFEDGAFSFTKVTFYGLDLTKIAASAGYTDASPWEKEAQDLYVSALAARDSASEEPEV